MFWRTIHFFGFLFCSVWLSAQGIFTEFGQNRIQYSRFAWKSISHANLEIIYYGNEEAMATRAMELAVAEMDRVENFLAYKYGGTMQIMVFANLNDYRQSNIGYDNPQMNTGGYLLIPNDINTVYFNGDYSNLSKQLTRAICDVILREMIYGGSLQDRFERVRAATLPVWFTHGLSQFLAESWSAETENRFRDAMAMHQFKNFNLLTYDESVLAGVGIWRYLVETYGSEALSTIVFIARYTHSAETAIYFHTKKNMVAFLADWRSFYMRELAPDINQHLPRGKSNVPARISQKRNTHFALSPDGQQVAIVTNDKGHFHIWKYSLKDKTVKHIYSGGLKVPNQAPDYQFPKVEWDPKSKQLYAVVYEKGKYKLLQLQSLITSSIKVDFSDFSSINYFSFDADGEKILFSAVKNGQSDLWVFDRRNRTMNRLTNDFYHDHDAIFAKDGSIIFVSNRPLSKDSSVNAASGVFNLFKLHNGVVTPLTNFDVNVNISDPISYSEKVTGFLCDASGLQNAWAVHADSGYTLFGLTNYQRGILAQGLAANGAATAEMLLLHGQYVLFTGEVPDDPISESVSIKTLPWKKKIENLDSLFSLRNQRHNSGVDFDDSLQRTVIDSAHNNYVFQTTFPQIDYQDRSSKDSGINGKQFKHTPFINSLQPEFLVSQSDNRVLGSYLQSNRIRHDALRNPIIMPFFKVTLSDVLKNYLIEAGVRSSLDLRVTDYLTRFSLLKYRIDHDFTLSRHSRKYDETNNRFMQNLSVQANYTMSYPFNENARLSLTLGGRRELLITKGSEKTILNIPDQNDYYATGKAEFVYDNTTAHGLNRMTGLRLKTGIDMIRNIQNSTYPIYNLFLDARYYLPIKRGIIWANKMSSVYAMGPGKVAYYLGGVENWTAKYQFEQNIPWLEGPQYLFQQWVSNLRGFNRGVRIGSSFALLNSELRVPVVAMIRHKPLESEFMRNFTITAFSDIGTAFIGSSPADPNNPFNTVYYKSPNYFLSVTSRRNPWVMGLGWGVRTRFLGYFIKFDRAIGYMERKWNRAVNYFSLGLDF